MDQSVKTDDVPVTGVFLSLVKILQSSRSRFIAEAQLAFDLDQSHPGNWLDRCRELFFKEFSSQFKSAGLSINEITFKSLMDLKIDEELYHTPYDDLPIKFVFNPWLHQDKGGIKKLQTDPLVVIESVCADFDGHGITSVGAGSALRSMVPHWKIHLSDGHSPNVISTDIDDVKNQLEIMRAEIMTRLNVQTTA